jgi:LAS superfamily LD-carboxypeptidase LdcB
MDRKQFLKGAFLAGTSLLLLPQLSFTVSQEAFSRDQLIGKGSPEFSGDGFKMQEDAYKSFLQLKTEAAKAGIEIEVVSAYRSFQRQKEIFEGKYLRFTAQGLAPMEAIQKIIEYSTIPGTSRHHWGTDIDIIDAAVARPEHVLEPEHFHGNGPFCKLKEWLTANANRFGFYEVYTDNAYRKGFKYEPWHFSYAPVSKPMLEEYKKLDIRQILQEEKLNGSEHFSEAFIEKYWAENILDINPELLP